MQTHDQSKEENKLADQETSRSDAQKQVILESILSNQKNIEENYT